MERLLDIVEASNILGLKKTTLYEWVGEKRIPYIKLGKRVLFDPADIKRFVESNKVGATV